MNIKLGNLVKQSTRNTLARAAFAQGEFEIMHAIVAEMYDLDMLPDPDVLYTLAIVRYLFCFLIIAFVLIRFLNFNF
jgi:hypothetical protein